MTRDEDDVDVIRRQTDGFQRSPSPPSGSVPLYGTTHPFCRNDRDSRPRPPAGCNGCHNSNVSAVDTAPALANSGKIGLAAEAIVVPGYAVSRLRPFLRRAAITRRPFLVAMRDKKPWTRLRRRLWGWNVRFTIAP
jgi:hypothetical protein